MRPLTQAVVLAGGRGERLRPLTDSVPKPLVDVNGRPFVTYVLDDLASQGITEVLFLTGYLGGLFPELLGHTYKGMSLDFDHGADDWATGERLLHAHEHLQEDFLLLYGDNLVAFSLARLATLRDVTKAPICLTVGSKVPGNVSIDAPPHVAHYSAGRRSDDARWVELGFMLVRRDVLTAALRETSRSLSLALESLAKSNQVAADQVLAPYFSISDPDRLLIAREAVTRKRVILIDRDGVINVKPPKAEYVTSVEHFEFIPESIEAMRVLSQHGFCFIVVSNQAGIARGVLSELQLDAIHSHMLARLTSKGIEITDVYVCPHHWDDGCTCRKPQPGMLIQAAIDHRLRLQQVVFVGDDVRDAEAALAAGCTPLLVGDGARADSLYPSLLDALDDIFAHYGMSDSEGAGLL